MLTDRFPNIQLTEDSVHPYFGSVLGFEPKQPIKRQWKMASCSMEKSSQVDAADPREYER